MGYQMKSYKKFVATAASATLVASAIVPVASASFTDVEETHEFATYINAAVEAGYVKGYEDGTFGINDKLKRSHVVLIIGRYLEKLGYTSEATTSPWSDVTSEEVIKYGNIVKDAGVFKGFADGTLKGNDFITRENMAVVLDRVAKTVTGTSLSEVAADIEDVEIADLATANADYQASIQALRDLEISTAKNFNPKGDVKRGQFAKFIVTTVETIDSIEVAPEVTAEDIKKEIEAVDSTLPAVKDITADNAEAAKVAVEAAKTAIAAIKEKIQVTGLTGEEVAELNKAIEAVEAKFALIVEAADKAVEAAKDQVIESVTQINGKQVEIKFSQAVNASTIIDAATGQIVANSALNLKEAGQTYVSLAGSKAKLSEDKKTLTVTLATALTNDKMYNVFLDNTNTSAIAVKNKDGKVFKNYEGSFIAKDTVAPTVKSVERINATSFKVTFSEPVSALGTVNATYADGSDLPSLDGLSNDFVAGNTEVVFTLGSAIEVGRNINVTIVGAKDSVNNLLSPNPYTFTISKQGLDGVKPSVEKATVVGSNKVEFLLSEEVEGFTIDDINVGGTPLTTADGTLEVDKTDAKKYTLTLNAGYAGIKAFAIDAAKFTDKSGETSVAFAQSLVFSEDTVKPTLTSQKVEKINGVETLVLTFSEEVNVSTSDVEFVGEQVLGFTTEAVTYVVKSAKIVQDTTDKKVVRIALADFHKGTANSGTVLTKDAKYTFDLAAAFVADLSTNANDLAKKAISFTRGEDIVTTFSVAATTPVSTYDATKGYFTVTFSGPVNETALNVDNYKIDGVAVKEVKAVVGDKVGNVTNTATAVTTVRVYPATGAITVNGERALTISGVQSVDGIVMEKAYETTISLTENVLPTVVKATLTQTGITASNQGAVVTLTFSENLDAATITEGTADFDVFYNGTKVATVTEAMGADNKTVTLKLKDVDLLTTDVSKLEIKAASTFEVKDTQGNVMADFGTLKVVLP